MIKPLYCYSVTVFLFLIYENIPIDFIVCFIHYM